MTKPGDIKLITFDVDGVLTDGSIEINDNGVETKRFHVRDGFAIYAARTVGMKIGILTARSSRCVTLRMTDLGVDVLMQGVGDKAVGFEMLCQQAGVDPKESAFLGDDVIDLPALIRCGYPMAVADAVDEVREVARFITRLPGGRGAGREAIEHILKAQGKWDQIVERFGI